MKCPKDQTHEVIENYAGGDKFFYCRGCKNEVKELAGKRADSDSVFSSMENLFDSSCKFDPTPTTIGPFLRSVVQQKNGFAVSFLIEKGLNSSTFAPEKWIPDVLDRPDSFHGVDRNSCSGNLAGVIWYQRVTSNSLTTIIETAMAYQDRGNNKPGHLWMHRDDFHELSVVTGMPTPVFYSGIFELTTAYGTISVRSCNDCPKGKVYLLDMGTWVHTTDFGTYCTAPGKNTVIVLNSYGKAPVPTATTPTVYSPLPGSLTPKTVFSRLEQVLTNELMIRDDIKKIHISTADFEELKKDGRLDRGHYMAINNCYIIVASIYITFGTLHYYRASNGVVTSELLVF